MIMVIRLKVSKTVRPKKTVATLFYSLQL